MVKWRSTLNYFARWRQAPFASLSYLIHTATTCRFGIPRLDLSYPPATLKDLTKPSLRAWHQRQFLPSAIGGGRPHFIRKNTCGAQPTKHARRFDRYFAPRKFILITPVAAAP